jgi:hypothetical protein
MVHTHMLYLIKHGFLFRYKLLVAEALIEHLNPIRLKIEDYLKNPDFLHRVLTDGSDRAREIATATMDEVKLKVGLGHMKEIVENPAEILKNIN